MQDNLPFCFFNVYKPKGITSFDVIYKLRKILNIKKIGHSGTLDPMAEGVMQVAAGNATRLLEYLDSNKEYIAEIKFGCISTTLDIEGEITKYNDPVFSKDELYNTLKDFTGEIVQIPPVYSAIKVNGKKLYEIARKNPDTKIEIPERKVLIHNIKLISFENNIAKIKVSCSKGTYIRTLADDTAKKLGTRAYLISLIRTKAGKFNIEESIKIDNINLSCAIEPKDVLELDEYKLNENEYFCAKNGKMINCGISGNKTIMLTYMDKLVSIGNLSDNKIKIIKFFNR